MVMAGFHKVGMSPESQILLYVFKRYFRDIVGSSLRRLQWISSGPAAEFFNLDIEFWSLLG